MLYEAMFFGCNFTTLFWAKYQNSYLCVTSVDTIRNPVVDVIGQLIRDVIGRLSVEPRCNWLGTLNSDRCVSIRL